MPGSETFAQCDADMQALIAEVTASTPPPVAVMGRRSFLKLAGLAGGGLVLAFHLDMRPAQAEVSGGGDMAVLNAFVRVAPDNTVTIFSRGPEIGQGIKTAFGLIVAEELDADWKTVRVDQAPIDPKVYGSQGAGGSTSIPRGWDPLRQAGAAARAMLIAAAASQWNVPAGECTAAESFVSHKSSGRKLSYGSLAKAASHQPVPEPASITLKHRSEYKLLGGRYTGVDNAKVVTGQPLFGIDVQLPGMLYASLTMCPAVGGKVKNANLDEIKKMPGVVDAFVLEGTGKPSEVMPGVAIIAKSTWQAFKGKAALKVDWDESDASKDSLVQAAARAKEVSAQLPAPEHNVGDVDAAFASAGNVSEAFYDYAMVSHQQLEPQNSTGWWHDGAMELWTPSQQADRGQAMVMKMLNLPYEKVIVHQTRAGGGFGRRLANDYLCEAAAIAMKVNAPVKLQWKREDDFAHDFYRVGGYHFLKGAIDKSGKLSAIQNHLVTFSAGGGRPVSGGALSRNSFPNDMAANVRYAVSTMPLQIPCGAMRGPTDNVQMFVAGSFLHELSVAAERDHVEFLLEWFSRPLTPPERPVHSSWATDPSRIFNPSRAAGVLKLAAEKAGWGKKLPRGRGLGIAFAFSYGGHVAEAVELSVDANKHITVHNITVVCDIGPVVNMSSAENQAQGGAIDALSTAMGLEISAEQGRIQQVNFGDYPILRMRSAPPVDVHFIQSEFRPSGLGEPCVPPLAAALGNAVYSATGERVRTMPFKRAGYSI